MGLFRRSQPSSYAIASDIAEEYVAENPKRSSESWLHSVKFAEEKLEEMQRMNFEGGMSAARGMLNSYQTAYQAALDRERREEEGA